MVNKVAEVEILLQIKLMNDLIKDPTSQVSFCFSSALAAVVAGASESRSLLFFFRFDDLLLLLLLYFEEEEYLESLSLLLRDELL